MYNSIWKENEYIAKRRLKKKYRISLLLVFTFVCLFGLIYSLINIINWKTDVDDNKKIIEDIKENIIIESKEEEQEAKYNIDFKSLKEQNSDVVAYIKVNGTNIDYVVVKGKDNSYYYCRNSLNKKICTKHRIRQNDLYNKIIELLNFKKLDDEIIEELNRDLITKNIDKIIVYEEEKVDVILKYERKIK